jgi:CheY-like chemotaxis protein
MHEKCSFPVGSAGIGRELRKILVIAEDPLVRDNVRVLLSSMGCQCVTASSARPELSILGQESPDAAIVDAQGSASATSEWFSGVDEICLSLRGRVVILTGKDQNPQLTDLIKRYDLPLISREQLFQDLWGTLNSLVRPIPVRRRIMQAARLIFDSFLQPAPVGIRVSHLHGRQFIYQAGDLMVDLSLEPPQTDGGPISLVGQLMDSARPERGLGAFSVGLQGSKAPIAMTSANKFGEFRFEFGMEQDVKLEIETAPRDWISIALPSLQWAGKRAAGGA